MMRANFVSISLILAAHVPEISSAQPAPAPDASLESCGAPDLPSARRKARRLVQRIRRDLAGVEDQIRHAPFLHAVESGTATPAQIAAIAAEEYSIVHSDLISFRQMADRWDSGTSHFFGDLDAGEAESLPLLLDFAAGVGLSEPELAAYEPRPRSQTYPSRVAWIASDADRASAAASFLVNFAVFGENMGRIRDALIAVYGFAPSQIEFFTFFAEPISGFEDAAIEVIATGLVEGACPVLVRRSARLLQAYELDFWQAAAEPPGSPLRVVFPHRP